MRNLNYYLLILAAVRRVYARNRRWTKNCAVSVKERGQLAALCLSQKGPTSTRVCLKKIARISCGRNAALTAVPRPAIGKSSDCKDMQSSTRQWTMPSTEDPTPTGSGDVRLQRAEYFIEPNCNSRQRCNRFRDESYLPSKEIAMFRNKLNLV